MIRLGDGLGTIFSYSTMLRDYGASVGTTKQTILTSITRSGGILSFEAIHFSTRLRGSCAFNELFCGPVIKYCPKRINPSLFEWIIAKLTHIPEIQIEYKNPCRNER